MDTAAGPLSGIRVLDLSRVLAGPYCAMTLGDLGAEVIKVERPDRGDDTRAWGPPWAGGESAYYLSINRNKQSITVDLKSPDGQEIIRELASKSDIVVENFRHGALEKLGIGYEQLSALNPGLIWATISGYGPTGPLAMKSGYDFVAQGEAGIMAITGEPDGDPMKVGVAIVDITAGLYAVTGILAALHERQTSGLGQKLDSSLYTSAIAWLANVGSNHLISGEPSERYGNSHANIVPYQTFRAQDQHITVGVGTDAQFRILCGILGIAEWADDPKFANNSARVANRDELIAKLQSIIETEDAGHWLEQLDVAAIPSGLINTVEQVFAHPQTIARNMVVELPHPTAGTIKVGGVPFELFRTPATIRTPPPLLGEHTESILSGLLGRSDEEIDALRKAGVIKS